MKQSELIGVKLMQKWEEMAIEKAEAREEGRKEGRTFEIYSMVQDGDISLECGAKRLGITILDMKDRMSVSGYSYPEANA